MTANLSPAPSDIPSSGRQEGNSEDETARPDETSQTPERPSDVSSEKLLTLFADEYACDIMRALEDGPMAASDLVEQCEMSRPTVYRRLNQLIDAGIARSELRPDPDGHHKKEFHLVLDEVEFRVQNDGIDGTVQVAGPAAD